MAKKIVNICLTIFCGLLFAGVTNAAADKPFAGIVCYEDSTPAPGVVVYALDKFLRPAVVVSNNVVMMAEHVTRAISDRDGRFSLDKKPSEGNWLLAADMEDQFTFAPVSADETDPIKLVIQKPANVKGRLLKGDNPVKGQKITARFMTEKSPLRYFHTAVTKADGTFTFNSLMPGEYKFMVIEEVPQVGCCFNSVITKQQQVDLLSGQQKILKLGGTDLPSLAGRITDTNGNALHGVWVKLEAKNEPNAPEPTVVWSEITGKNGSYRIFDIPPGEYKLYCFRRLTLNNSSRTLQIEKDIVIETAQNKSESHDENICNISVDLNPFMPLKYGQAAPTLSGELLNGESFELQKLRGKIVVLYFYASWCRACASSTPFFNGFADEFDTDKVVVLGISLDNSIDECKRYVSERQIRYPQLFAGPWTNSRIRKDFRVVNVPTILIIDAAGTIAQIDLFGPTLKEFVHKLLESN